MASKKIILKKLKGFDCKIWHPESKLVFRSQKEKIVIGTFIEDSIVPLDEISFAICKKWRFKADESLLEKSETEEEENDEEQEDAKDEEEDEEQDDG